MIIIKKIVSVIITTYKNHDNLERAINSILNQTYKHIEIVVIDDNNPESDERKKTEEVMSKFKDVKFIKYIKHDKNLNGSAARNTGIKNSIGEYISFLDDDDEYINTKIEKQVKLIEKSNNKYSGCCTNVIIKKFGIKVKEIKLEMCNDFKRELLLKNFNLGTGSNIFLKRDVLKELNGFDETFIRHQDIEFMIRFFRNHNICIIPEELIVKHDDVKNNYPNSKKLIEVKNKLLNKYEVDINEYDIKTRNDIYYVHYFEIVRALIKEKNFNEAFRYIKLMRNYRDIEYNTIFKIIVEIIDNYISLRKLKFMIKKYKISR